ncbi:unnamed protein product [Mytilus coruscus]|uniref:Uncharacterized protein n=1 Tax=Mytilus coruscus TaxID=42192 RepID=A0A6J8F0F6_MYTCO|nr:unnamed protein product [Mytilus coruscus]
MKMNNMKQTLDTNLTSFQTSYNVSVNDLQTKEINPLRQSVQLNTDEIYSLATNSNEQARSQDFVALYNITTSTRKKVTEMETITNNIILQLKHNHTTEKAMNHIFDNQLTSFRTDYSSTINDLKTKELSMQKQITENNERGMLKDDNDEG